MTARRGTRVPRYGHGSLWLLAGLVCSAGAAVPLLAGQQEPAAPPANDVCLVCHGEPGAVDARDRSIAVEAARFDASVHGSLGLACVDCHTDLATTEEFPHPERLAPVRCETCHDAPVEAYARGIHAIARRQNGNTAAATCVDCHTAHEIQPAADPASPTYPLNLPATCSRCHGNPDVIARGHIAIGNVSALYADSIHGRAVTRSGLLVAANCGTCHGSHDIRPKSDPDSRVHRTNIPGTCGSCHEGILRIYEPAAHGSGLAAGQAPVCSDCHTAHDIQRTEVANWQLDVIGECGTCHANQMRTYRDTFHGQVTALGFTRVATCADCHTGHAVYPVSDPRSTVSADRRLETCRQCHTAATEGFAQYDPHADKDDPERNPVLFYTARAMHWLLIGVFGFFSLHTVLWLPRSFAARRQRRLRARPAPPPEPAGPPEE